MLRHQDWHGTIGGLTSTVSIWTRHRLQHQIDYDAVQAPNFPYPIKEPPATGGVIIKAMHSYRRRRN